MKIIKGIDLPTNLIFQELQEKFEQRELKHLPFPILVKILNITLLQNKENSLVVVSVQSVISIVVVCSSWKLGALKISL